SAGRSRTWSTATSWRSSRASRLPRRRHPSVRLRDEEEDFNCLASSSPASSFPGRSTSRWRPSWRPPRALDRAVLETDLSALGRFLIPKKEGGGRPRGCAAQRPLNSTAERLGDDGPRPAYPTGRRRARGSVSERPGLFGQPARGSRTAPAL